MDYKILLVDDEEHILSGFKRNLRTHFNVHTAVGGKMGLIEIKNNGPFAVVVSDFKMPEMNGNQFLTKVKDIAPDTVRLMLTGFADLPTTIDAVNDGHIFRILTKPCSSEKLISSINDGIKQYNLITAEKELLDKTLKGTIRILIDILSSVNPVAFSRVSRFQKFILPIGELLNVPNKWELEIAALLSQIGLVTMPPELLNRKYLGEHLDAEQEIIYTSHPAVGKSLLSKIPRLENIAEAIYYQFNTFSKTNNENDSAKFGQSLPIISRILKVLNCFDTLVEAGFTNDEAIKKLREKETEFDPNILIALDAVIAGIYSNLTLHTVEIKEIEPGTVAAADIKDKYNQVLITKGAEITQIVKMKLLNYAKLGNIDTQIKILK